MTYYTQIQTPVGKILITSNETHITGASMDGQKYAPVIEKDWVEKKDLPPLALAEKQFQEYFSGQRKEFSLPLQLKGSDFQKRVWEALSQIPFGETISYAELARRIDNPKAVRAVGLANGKNPVTIIIPCHRVIGANGSLTGYGGGLSRKKFLLDLESQGE